MARNKDSKDTKSEILRVSANLFAQNGYERTTVEDILNDWGGSKGSLYYYFKSKEEILNAVVDSLVESEEKRIKDVLEETKLPALAMLQVFLAACLNRPEPLGGLEGFIYQSQDATLINRIVKLYVAKSIPLIEPILKQGIEEGVFHTEYPAEILEFALLIEEFAIKYPLLESDEAGFLRKIAAFQTLLELSLGLDQGSLRHFASFCVETRKQQSERIK